MKVLIILAWIGVLGGCAVGALILVGGMSTAQGAPQEAVVICLAIAVTVIPYCGARALTEIYKLPDDAPKTEKAKQPAESNYNYEGLSIIDKT